MDIYEQKSKWKLYLAIAGFVIVLITIVYSKYLADRLAENERNNVELYAETVKYLTSAENSADELAGNYNLALLFLEKLIHIPVILENENGILDGNNYGESRNNDQEFLINRRNSILKHGYAPIEGTGYARYVYYENSKLYTLITYFPVVQFLLLSAFILIGYFSFSSARKAEQNRVWAGMAKETAHQLGTPISAILAWLEHLKDLNQGNNDQLEIISELGKDVNRLELIADRFSKIGSDPKLELVNVYEKLNECKNYMQKRAAKKVIFSFPEEVFDLKININSHLFEWVIENLLRNALDAMENTGEIKVIVKEEPQTIDIEISDTGKGIPQSKYKTVFNPGYSTKKRGWGLGLSLAKRIIEDYHKGKIFVKHSKLDQGTTFTIQMPKV